MVAKAFPKSTFNSKKLPPVDEPQYGPDPTDDKAIKYKESGFTFTVTVEAEVIYRVVGEVVKRLETIRQHEAEGKNSASGLEFITLAEAQKILPLKSKSSWQTLRDSGELTFSKCKNLILYNRASILEYIRKNKVSQFK